MLLILLGVLHPYLELTSACPSMGIDTGRFEVKLALKVSIPRCCSCQQISEQTFENRIYEELTYRHFPAVLTGSLAGTVCNMQ